MPMALRIAEGEGTAQMKESGQSYTPATSPSWKKSQWSLERSLGEPQRWSEHCWEDKDSFCMVSESQFLSHSFHSLVTILH
jgi:hypothetical protein